MRKHLCNQIIELVSTVIMGINHIKNSDLSSDTEILLKDCFDATLSIEEHLAEQLSATRHADYRLIFDEVRGLLEQVFQETFSQTLNTGALGDILNLLHTTVGMLSTDPEVRYEVVFLPYNASMWDSFESIWRATKEDPRCDCYVVPIPYYTAEGLEYEGNLFREDIRVTHFSEYDLSTHMPDVIYIHNPYDNNNSVTAVASPFYTSELKKVTEHLVYVPYFVVENKVDESIFQLHSMGNIDYIVVQSEKVRQTYLKYLPEGKVVALGSPKFDKVIQNQLERPSIPLEWKEKIKNRKVVLYNTSLSGLMLDTGKYLLKIKYVIESFQNKDDVVLLWRPHPLIKPTLLSMDPQFLSLYLLIEEYFIRKDIGILDLTPDVHTAIAISDILYGDSSSIYPLFALTGKPVVQQNLDLISHKSEVSYELSFDAMAFQDERKMFGFTPDFNGIFEVDLLTYETQFRGGITNKLDTSIISMEMVGDKLILVPFKHNREEGYPEFVEYSIRHGKFELIKLELKDQLKNTSHTDNDISYLFSTSFTYGDTVFFIPFHYDALVQYDVKEGKVSYHRDFYREIETFDRRNEIKRKLYFSSRVCQNRDTLYLSLSETNQVLKFSMKTGKHEWLDVGDSGNRYDILGYENNHLWLTTDSNDALIRYNLENSLIDKQIDYKEDKKEGLLAFGIYRSLIYADDHILLIPFNADKALQINVLTGEKQITDSFPVEPSTKTSLSWYMYSRTKSVGENIYSFNRAERFLYRYNPNNSTSEQIKLSLNIDEVDDLLIKNIVAPVLSQTGSSNTDSINKFVIYEQLINGDVLHFLSLIMNFASERSSNQITYIQQNNSNADGTCGEKIHQYIKSVLEQK